MGELELERTSPGAVQPRKPQADGDILFQEMGWRPADHRKGAQSTDASMLEDLAARAMSCRASCWTGASSPS